MSSQRIRYIFVVSLVVNCILWSAGRYSVLVQHKYAFNQRGTYESRPMSTDMSYYSLSQASSSYVGKCQPLAYEVNKQCKHVQSECLIPETLMKVNYTHSYFCASASRRPVILVGLLLWLIFLFSTLGITASEFFSPNLETMSRIIGIDHSVAGVTLLALGNGSPDVFSTFSAIRADSGSLAIGELLGAASFIASCVVGSLCIISPFRVSRAIFFRDVGFFALSVALFFVIVWDNKIDKAESGALITLYFVYVFFVVLGTWWKNHRTRSRVKTSLLHSGDSETPRYNGNEPSYSQDVYRDLPAKRFISVQAHCTEQSQLDSRPEAVSSYRHYWEANLDVERVTPPLKRCCPILLVIRNTARVLCPHLFGHRQRTTLSRISTVLTIPVVLCLTLTLPVVATTRISAPGPAPEETRNHTDSVRVASGGEGVLVDGTLQEFNNQTHCHAYNKYVMACQCILAPLFCVNVLFGGITEKRIVLYASLIPGAISATVVLTLSGTGSSQVTQMIRCSTGFFVAIVWIMAVADEIVRVLQAFGLIFGLSDAIIGLTIFAAGNSLSDFMANISVAAFSQIMSFSACFGGPMLNILLGIGVSTLYIINTTSQPYLVELSPTLLVSGSGLLSILITTLVYVPLNDFCLSRRFGITLISLYSIIMIIIVLSELKA